MRTRRRLFESGPTPRALISIALAISCAACTAPGPAGGDRPTADYDDETGRLQRVVFDSDDDGRNDAIGIMDGTRIHRIELDTNANGTLDRWEFYDDDARLREVGVSRRDDGVMDAVAGYGADGQLQRLEVSTQRDGRFDRVEFYEAGLLARAEEDTDGDGRVDTWEAYRRNPRSGPGQPPSVVSMVAFDEASAGRPTRRLIYGPGATVTRVEIDPDGDGTFTVPQAGSR